MTKNDQWKKENSKILSLRLFDNTDKDINNKLDSLPQNTKTTYIKSLIRKDIENA